VRGAVTAFALSYVTSGSAGLSAESVERRQSGSGAPIVKSGCRSARSRPSRWIPARAPSVARRARSRERRAGEQALIEARRERERRLVADRPVRAEEVCDAAGQERLGHAGRASEREQAAAGHRLRLRTRAASQALKNTRAGRLPRPSRWRAAQHLGVGADQSAAAGFLRVEESCPRNAARRGARCRTRPARDHGSPRHPRGSSLRLHRHEATDRGRAFVCGTGQIERRIDDHQHAQLRP